MYRACWRGRKEEEEAEGAFLEAGWVYSERVLGCGMTSVVF